MFFKVRVFERPPRVFFPKKGFWDRNSGEPGGEVCRISGELGRFGKI